MYDLLFVELILDEIITLKYTQSYRAVPVKIALCGHPT